MFSKATEYALRAIIYIARNGSEEYKLSLKEIANAIGSPQSFTAKILQSLSSRNSIISATRGPNGGYFITEKSKHLPLRSILVSMKDDKLLNGCILGLKECSESKPCPLHSDYKGVKLQLISLFDNKSIYDLVDGGVNFLKLSNKSTNIKK